MTCPICDFPTVWSEHHERTWCAVYGDHHDHPPRLSRHPVIDEILELETGRRPTLQLIEGMAS